MENGKWETKYLLSKYLLYKTFVLIILKQNPLSIVHSPFLKFSKGKLITNYDKFKAIYYLAPLSKGSPTAFGAIDFLENTTKAIKVST